MKTARFVALTCAAFCTAAIAADNPLDQLKGKMKEGLYDYKMEMDLAGVPGLPPGMGKQNMSFQKCVTAEDIEKGQMARGRDGKMPESCEVKNFRMSGDTASYTMTCAQPAMSADNQITFTGDGFKMDMKMAMSQGGQMMNMTQRMEGRYVGPCNK
jgi:hypothetical protein